MKISVVIATKNEEAALPACLESVMFADEVVIVDDESTDRTNEITEAVGAKIYRRKMDGFATQKNYGIDKASNNWVLILDADERVDEQLGAEIKSLKAKAGTAAYSIPFKNYIGRRWLRHGGLYPDRHIRLFDKRLARYGSKEVHEELEINGKIGNLDGHINHLTYANLSEYLAKVHKYARLEGKAGGGKPKYRHALKEFLYRYFRQKGYKDGWYGLASALLLSYYLIVKRWAMK